MHSSFHIATPRMATSFSSHHIDFSIYRESDGLLESEVPDQDTTESLSGDMEDDMILDVLTHGKLKILICS